jgi:hypothetical protein
VADQLLVLDRNGAQSLQPPDGLLGSGVARESSNGGSTPKRRVS